MFYIVALSQADNQRVLFINIADMNTLKFLLRVLLQSLPPELRTGFVFHLIIIIVTKCISLSLLRITNTKTYDQNILHLLKFRILDKR